MRGEAMTVARRASAVAIALAIGLPGVAAVTGAARSESAPLGPSPVTITLDVNYSRFTPDVIEVRAGTPVTFVVRNHDPIDHELIVGDAAVHAAHESGTHAAHGAVPGEVSVGAGETARTTYVFAEPGTVVFACHLPQHFDYGMHGRVRVRA
jgi:uncharacterized cupredoxin-like copper-binding protein